MRVVEFALVLAAAVPGLAKAGGALHPAVSEDGEEDGTVVLHVQLPEGGEAIAIPLRPNSELFADSYKVVEIGRSGETVEHVSDGSELCQFVGEAPGELPNSAAFSLCNGAVSGVFHVGDLTLFASARDSDAMVEVRDKDTVVGMSGTHARGLVDSVLAKKAPTVVVAGPNATKPRPPILQRPPRDLVVEIAVVNDAERLAMFDNDKNATMQASAAAINIMNAMFTAFSPIGPITIQLTMGGQAVFLEDYNPFATRPDQNNEYDAMGLIEDFNEWRNSVLDQLPSHDVAHLFSGRDFLGSNVGLAFVSSVCDRDQACDELDPGYCFHEEARGCCFRAAGSVTSAQVDSETTAIIAAHELGHQLGLEHVDPETPCGTDDMGRFALMLPYLSTWVAAEVGLSDCSRSAFLDVWQADADKSGFHSLGCLANRPSTATTTSPAASFGPTRAPTPQPTVLGADRGNAPTIASASHCIGPLPPMAVLLLAAAVARAVL